MKGFFVTGIDTNIGKTLVSAILVQKLQWDYWKPIQSGSEDGLDSKTVQNLLINHKSVIHPEAYVFKKPVSPHLAATLENKEISLSNVDLPTSTRPIIVEGAGGIMVPLNQHELILDLIIQLKLPVILVSKNYLGSINHTLLSLDILQKHQVTVKGIIFNGEENKSTEEFITQYSKVHILGRIPFLHPINKQSIADAAKYIRL